MWSAFANSRTCSQARIALAKERAHVGLVPLLSATPHRLHIPVVAVLTPPLSDCVRCSHCQLPNPPVNLSLASFDPRLRWERLVVSALRLASLPEGSFRELE